MASQSGSEQKKPRRQQTQTYESEGEESEDYQPRQKRRGQRQQRGAQGPLDNLALGNVQNTAGGLVNTATGALGNVAGNAVDNQQKGSGKSDTLRLRLDLNLDVEITLKAKIHGDLELALLYVATFSILVLAVFRPQVLHTSLPLALLFSIAPSCCLPRLKLDAEKPEQHSALWMFIGSRTVPFMFGQAIHLVASGGCLRTANGYSG
jgi:hypothetical protein